MNMKINVFLFLFFTLILGTRLFANDGVFYVQGNNLIPLQETQVELRKEVLKFFVTDYEWMKVDVDFTFYNPGKAKTVIVGFVTPPASGDTDEDQHPQIKNFTVNIEGKDVKFEIKRMSESTFSFKELKLGERDFVYYFPVTFKTGFNRVRHTYSYRGGSSVELQRDFAYQITTGKRWANRQIDDFELEVHLDNGIYAVPATFSKDGTLADWEIVGNGVMQERPLGFFSEDGPKVRMAHLNRGFFSLKEKNFKPDNDIIFAEFNWAAGWVERWCDFAMECIDRNALEKVVPYFNLKPWDGITPEDLKELSAFELRIVRNYFFAVRGYEFRSEDLRKFYSQFFWYQPDSDLKSEAIRLSNSEGEFVKKLKAAENMLESK